jgi:imidazolonepropionase-like amidohydrolase
MAHSSEGIGLQAVLLMTLLRALAAAVGTGMLAIQAAPPPSPAKVLRFGHLWDGAQLIDDASVVIEGTKITAVGARVTAPGGAEETDLRKYTAIPGLIDLHTHTTYYWNRDPATKARDPITPPRTPAQTAELSFDNARRTLETGVTTVRDLGAGGGADYLMRAAINDGQKIGPRMFVAGAGISAGRTPPTLDELRELTATRVRAGSDWVKVYGSVGSYDSVATTQTLTFDQMKAIVDAAHGLGRPVAIHSYGASGVHDAVLAGADSVEHGIEIDDETFKEMVARGTVWVPTIDHNRYYVDAQDDFGFTADKIPPLQDYIAKNLDAASRAVKAGVRLGMGSDAVYSMFGQNTRELAWFVKAGLTPAQALATATTTAAVLLGHANDLGRLAPGFLADIVAIDGQPLEKIDDAITSVKWVMKDGKVVVDKR